MQIIQKQKMGKNRYTWYFVTVHDRHGTSRRELDWLLDAQIVQSNLHSRCLLCTSFRCTSTPRGQHKLTCGRYKCMGFATVRSRHKRLTQNVRAKTRKSTNRNQIVKRSRHKNVPCFLVPLCLVKLQIDRSKDIIAPGYHSRHSPLWLRFAVPNHHRA